MFAALSLCAVLAAAPDAGVKSKPAVAILYFDYTNNKDDEFAALRKGLASMLISELADLSQVRLVERERLQDLIAELDLAQSNKIDRATAVKIGKMLGAHYLVMGTYFVLQGALTVTWRVDNLELAYTIKGQSVTRKSDEFFQIEQIISAALRTYLAEQVPALKAEADQTAPTPPKPPSKLPTKIALDYSRALNDLDQKNKAAARARLEEVVKAQPDFELAALDLAALMK